MKLYLFLLLTVVSQVSAFPINNEMRRKYALRQSPFEMRADAKELMKRDLLGDVMTYKYTTDDNMHIDIMREIIEEELTKTTAKLVVRFVSRQHEDFLYPGYMKVFKTIEEKTLGDAIMFHLAYQIKKDLHKGQVLSLQNLFPTAVWSMLTSSKVCIKNKGFGEFFFAGVAEKKYDAQRRNVFTWMTHREAGAKGNWKFEHIEGNKFHIINSRFNEYLYAEDDSHKRDAERRQIFTWMPEWNPDNDANVWAIEMDGEDVFIKNVHYDEYMYTLDGAPYDEQSRRVLTWIPKGRNACDSSTYQCRWMFYAC